MRTPRTLGGLNSGVALVFGRLSIQYQGGNKVTIWRIRPQRPQNSRWSRPPLLLLFMSTKDKTSLILQSPTPTPYTRPENPHRLNTPPNQKTLIPHLSRPPAHPPHSPTVTTAAITSYSHRQRPTPTPTPTIQPSSSFPTRQFCPGRVGN